MFWGKSGARVKTMCELATPRAGKKGQHVREKGCRGGGPGNHMCLWTKLAF